MSISSRFRKSSLPLLLCSGLFAASTQAADTPQLELSAWLDEPGGSLIASGDYLEAASSIELRLRSARPLDKVIAYNNLCVAKTMLGEFDAAESACNAAVTRARSYERSLRFRDRSASAKALSNRGVLNVLTGDLQQAFVDLEKASARSRDASMAPARNLAWLGERFSEQSFAGAE